MSELLTMQDLANGHLDVKALGEAANGDENTQVITRTGETYPSAKKAIKTMFQQGGLPAEPFKTKTSMQTEGASLANGTYAVVTGDVNKQYNGYYQRVSGEWVRTDYQPVTNHLNGTPIDVSTLTIIPIAIAYQPTTAKWEGGSKFPYAESYLLPVNSGDSFYIKAQENAGAYVTFIGSAIPDTGGTLYNPDDSYAISQDTSIIITAPSYAKNLVIRKRLLASPTNAPVNLIKQVGGKAFSSLFTLPQVTNPQDGQIVNSTDFIKVKRQVDALTLAASPFITISDSKLISGGFVEDSSSLVEDTSNTVDSFELSLLEGDVLTFDYLPFNGVVLWIWKLDDYGDGVLRSYPMLSRGSVSTVPTGYTFSATQDMTVRLSNAIVSSIKVNGGDAILTSLGNWSAKLSPVYTTRGANNTYKYNRISDFIKVAKGDRVKVGTMPLGGAGLVVLNFDTYQFETAFAVPFGYTGDRSLDWVAEKDCYIRVCDNGDSEISIKKAGQFVPEDKLTVVAKSVDSGGSGFSDYLPEKLELPNVLSTVFATSMNFILKTQKRGGTDYILISRDLGETWTEIENIIGDIVHYHFFADGTIMLCSPLKVYWTDDYLTLNESTVLDYDGSVFAPTYPSRHFFAMQNSDKVHMTNGGEMFVWGDYTLNSTPRIWYTTDRGRTIKAAAKFGTTVMDGATRNVRHVHRINYRSKDGYWYITTGDHTANGVDGGENMVLRAAYDWDTDTWSWKFYNSGWDFKFGAILFDDIYAYLVTDYTNPDQQEKQGVYRVLPEFLGDLSKYEQIYKPDQETIGDAAFSRLLMDKQGNKVILPDWKGIGNIWVARSGFNFKRIPLSANKWLAYIIGANYNGDVYCVVFNTLGEVTDNGGENIRLNRGTYNLTEILRAGGIDNFMRGETLLGDSGSVSEQA